MNDSFKFLFSVGRAMAETDKKDKPLETRKTKKAQKKNVIRKCDPRGKIKKGYLGMNDNITLTFTLLNQY